jgi:hypothetical protein
MSGRIPFRTPLNVARHFVNFMVLTSLLLAGIIGIEAAPASAAITTTAVADEAGSNTAATLGGTPIREGATLAGGETIGIGTSALLNPGVGAREIRTQYDANTVYQAGTARAPEGWTLSYSINNGTSWLSAEPSPASAVTDIKASAASVAAGAIDGYSQTYSTETTASVPSSTFSTSTGGDGWGVAFYDNYIFNIYHHDESITKLDCHLRTTGARCLLPAITYPATITSPAGINFASTSRSDVVVDPLAGRLYSLTMATTGDDFGKAGILCIDVKTNPVFCGFTVLGSKRDLTTNNVSWSGAITEPLRLANKVYGVAASASGVELLCFDLDTADKCLSGPVELFASGTSSRLEKIGTKLFVASTRKLTCWDTATSLVCPGVWPRTLNAATAETNMITVHESAGVQNGICTRFDCFDLGGTAKTGAGWVNPYSLGSIMYVWIKGVTVLGRHYFSNDSFMRCFDYATEQACAGFTSPTFALLYHIAVDPENPSCLWTDSNDGSIINMNAMTGAAGCTANPVVTLQPSQFAPRYACSTEQGIDQWRVLKISNLVGGGTANSILLTVRNPLGNPVAGFTDLPVTVGQDLDLTGMNIELSGSRPTFSFAFSLSAGSITSATIAVEYKGKGPELCSTATLKSPVNLTTAAINSYFTDSVGLGNSYQSVRNFNISSTTASSNLYLTVPTTPRNLTGAGLNTNATLTFAAPSDNGGLELGSYQISRDGGSTWTIIDNLADNGDGTFSVSVTNLTPGQTYPMRIAATNSLGRGAAASLSLSAQVVDFGNIPDTQQNAGPIYLATQVSAGFPYTYTASPAGVCTVAGNTVTLVAVGTCTLVQNQVGDSTHLATTATSSFVVLANPVIITAPSAPISLAVTPGSSQVSLTWAAPTNLGNGVVTDYVIQYKVGTSWVPFTDGTSVNTFAVVPGLTNGTAYSFKVAAVNSAGQGVFSAAINGTPAGTPGAATALSSTKTATTAALTWTAPASNGGSAITDYIVEYKLSDVSTWTTFADGVSTAASASITGLLDQVTYDVQVTPKNIVGTGPSVSTVTLSVTNNNAALALSWAANTDGATIVNHIVQHRVLGSSVWIDTDTVSANRTTSLTGLINGTEYEVRVARMLNSTDVSSYTSTVRAKPFTFASAPVLTATPGIAQVTLTWVAPAANGSAISDYILHYRVTGATNWLTLNDGISLNTSSVIIGLTNGTSYDFEVAAANGAGTSAFSTAAIATPRRTPGAISGLVLTPAAGGLTLAWVAPTDNGGAPITDYEVQYKEISSTLWRTLVHPVTTATAHSIANLDGLSRYSVRIAAVNAAGIGAFGAAGSEITAAVVVAPQQTESPVAALPQVDTTKASKKLIKQHAREKVTFDFLKVSDVFKVVIDNREIPFVVADGVITITDPGLEPGDKEVRISGAWGTITLLEKLQVIKAAAVVVAVKPLTVSVFAAGSSVLTPKIKALVKKFVAQNFTKSAMVCAGYTSGPSVLGVDPALAAARAKAVCAYAKSLNRKLTFATRGFNTLVNNAAARKVLVSFTR